MEKKSKLIPTDLEDQKDGEHIINKQMLRGISLRIAGLWEHVKFTLQMKE